MIIQCEKCRTKFNIDESLLKGEGSKLRCSRCKHIFVASPPEQAFHEEAEIVAVGKEELEQTVALDSSPISDEAAPEPEKRDKDMDFDDVFEESMEDLEKFEAISPEDLKGLLKEELPDARTPTDEVRTEKIPSPAQTEEEVEEEPIREDEGPVPVSAPEKPRRAPLLLIILFLILALMGAGIAIFFWAPGLIPDPLSFLKPVKAQVSTDRGVRRLRFPAVKGSFVDSEKAGQLFVIQGTVRNEYPKSRSFILIKGTILDDKGKPIKTRLGFAGNPLNEARIKILSMEEINKAMKNRLGIGRKNVNLAPGATLSFTIVFENLPDNLGEFTVEAASSSPGK